MSAQSYRSLLSAEEGLLYTAILDGLLNRAESIHIPPHSPAAVNRLISFVLRDHPEIAWTCGQWKGEVERTSVIIPVYTLDQAGIQAFQTELSLMKNALQGMAEIPEAQRVQWVFDFLVDNIVYDLHAPHSQDAYGVLIDGRAVCRGIAKGAQLLLRACGLEAIVLEGQLNEEALHCWNAVFLSDGCYHLDLTMGYPMFSALYTRRGLPYNKYAAFCVSDETLRRTHRWKTEDFPVRCPRDLLSDPR